MPRLHGEFVVTHVVLMGQLSRWMAGARVAVADLTPARLEEFLDSRRAGGDAFLARWGGGGPKSGRGGAAGARRKGLDVAVCAARAVHFCRGGELRSVAAPRAASPRDLAVAAPPRSALVRGGPPGTR